MIESRPDAGAAPGFSNCVGYSVLRSSGISGLHEVCVVAPFVDEVIGLRLDLAGKSVTLDLASSSVRLGDLPADVLLLLDRDPSRVLFVLADTFSRARQAFSGGQFTSVAR